jgi:hypothetical protein
MQSDIIFLVPQRGDQMKTKFALYAIIAMVLQVGLGYLTNQGQGSIGLLIFILLVEIDKDYSFKYMLKKLDKSEQKENEQ